jgi:hypothetical protein
MSVCSPSTSSKPGYTSIICSSIENIPYNLIFTAQFNDSSILIMINSWDYLNLSVANESVDHMVVGFTTTFLCSMI